MNKTDEELNQAEKMAKRHGVLMCDENGDTHGEELYCVGIDDIADIIREALADHIADTGKVIAEPVKQEPVAFVSDVHLGRYTLEWNGQPLPEGTKLYDNYYLEQMAEDAECIKLSLNKAGVPTIDESGKVYSLWGRVCRYAAPVSAKREWVDLTDDEIFDAYTSDAHENTPKSFARAVVAAFKEKNK